MLDNAFLHRNLIKEIQMKDFFHSFKFKIIICIFSLVFGFMIYAAVQGGNVIFPKSILETITQPFAHASSSISAWVENTLDALVNAQKYKSENKELREKLNEIYSQVRDKDKTDEENALLREMLEIEERHPDYEWSAPCTVIARNANDIYGGFTIDKGKADGIDLRDPVFTSIGLVGVITEVSDNYSVVTTILSPDVTIGAVTADNDVVGIIENDVNYSAEGCCLMSYINKNSNIETEESVLTSGGSVFPADMLIGSITEIYNDSNGLTLHAVIRPYEDVFSVTDVFVVTSFEGQGNG